MTRFARHWDPWRELNDLQNEMNRLFRTWREPTTRRVEYPPVNVWKNDESVLLTTELPGYSAEDFDVNVTSGAVGIQGKPRGEELAESEAYRRQERPTEGFSRTIDLPVEVDPEKTEATYEQGVLTLKLSRPEEQKPRKVSVKAG